MLRKNQKQILSKIESNPYITQQELAKELGLSRSTVANLISDLVDKGYLLGRAYIMGDTYSRKVACIGGANVDIKSIVKQNIVFESSNPCHTITFWGGVIRNIAENLSHLQVSVGLLSVVGDDGYGVKLLEEMRPLMDVSKVSVLANQNTGKYHAILDQKGDLVIGLADMSIIKLIDKRWIDERLSYLSQFEYWVIDTNPLAETIEFILEKAKELGKKVILIGVSAIKTQNLPSDLSSVSVAIFNLDESQYYFKTDESDPLKLAKLWRSKGIDSVVVTRGAKSLGINDKDYEKELDVLKIESVVDVTGAGDSFSAGVIYGLVHENDLERSCRLGLICSKETILSSETVSPRLSSEFLEKEITKYE